MYDMYLLDNQNVLLNLPLLGKNAYKIFLLGLVFLIFASPRCDDFGTFSWLMVCLWHTPTTKVVGFLSTRPLSQASRKIQALMVFLLSFTAKITNAIISDSIRGLCHNLKSIFLRFHFYYTVKLYCSQYSYTKIPE